MRDKCPECGGELQASVIVYLKNVVLDDDDLITSYDLAFSDDEGVESLSASLCLEEEVHIYCENDHEIARY